MKQFWCAILLSLMGTGSVLTQILDLQFSGRVRDAMTGEALPGVSILLTHMSNSKWESVSDLDGHFVITGIPAGRYVLRLSSLGYQSKTIAELEIHTGIGKQIDFYLQPSAEELQEVVVKAESRTRSTESLTSIQTLTVEESFRYPGTFYDPARLATHYAGVINENDQANNLVIRGNSPNGLGWYLEGMEIVNPNHLSNAGTFNDRSSQSGGGVNILSAQMLDNSTFLTGAFPANYGNATSGVFDMQLRKGATDGLHFTGQAGLLGLDAALEGPLSKDKNHSFLINYRYSTIGLLSQMGVDLGDESINFQDLSFHLKWDLGKQRTLSWFGMGGFSENIFESPEPEERETFKDLQNIQFEGRTGITGLKYEARSWQHTLMYSGYEHERTSRLFRDFTGFLAFENDETSEQRIGLHSRKDIRLKDGRLQVGLRANLLGFRVISAHSLLDQDLDNENTSSLIQGYVDLRKNLSNKWFWNAGIHVTNFSFSNSLTVEPRIGFKYSTGKQEWVWSYGLHSRMAAPAVLLLSGQGSTENTDLGLTRSHHLVLSHRYQLNTQARLITEVFYQYQDKIPIAPGSNRSLSPLNTLDYLFAEHLVSEGKGKNAGLEVTFQQYFSRSTYFLLNGTIYDSQYQGGDGQWRNTRYNGEYGFNFTAGKEFDWQKSNKLKSIGINLRVTYFGGFWEGPIDVDASTEMWRTIFEEETAFTEKLPDFFKADFRFYYKRVKPKFTSILGLDLLNATNQENIAYHYYDFFTKEITPRYHLGIIPNLSYRIEF